MLISRRKDPVAKFAFVLNLLKDAQIEAPVVKHRHTRRWSPQVGDVIRVRSFAVKDFAEYFVEGGQYTVSDVKPDMVSIEELKDRTPYFPIYYFIDPTAPTKTAMASDRMKSSVLKQISKEFASASLYYSMGDYFKAEGLDGLSGYVGKMADEEIGHASDFYDIVFQDIEGKQQTPEIEMTERTWDSPIDVFNDILSNEQMVTESINGLMEMAKEDGDPYIIHFLNDMLDGQAKDMAELEHIIGILERFGGNIEEIMEFDKEIMHL